MFSKYYFLTLFAVCSLQSTLSYATYDVDQEADNNVRVTESRFEEVVVSGQVKLHVNQGTLLNLPKAASKVLIANPQVASFQMPSPDNVFVFAKAPGDTTLYALDENNDVIIAVTLTSGYDLAGLTRQVAEEVPGTEVQVGPATDKGLIVRGTVQTPQQAKQVISSVESYLGASTSTNGPGGAPGQGLRIVNQLKVALSSQVNISVRIVEVSRSLSHSLGFSWDALFDNNTGFIRNGSSLFDASTGVFDGSGITNGVLGGTIGNVGGVLSALSSDGMASILAEPNLTAMSGETAGFAVGGEVPIVIQTNNSVTIEYKQYGVIMRMTPTLLSPNRISLHIAPEVSDLSDEGSVVLSDLTVPAFKVRRADTTVELASGQSFALAGMLRSSVSQTVSGVPGLRSIPGLGRLFETEASEKEETELVIIATAYIVEPTSASNYQSPAQGISTIEGHLPPLASAGYLY
ncbi:type II and III secretion system protein family protein [Marinomonas posidonica]|uniref:Type II and III secretion system protein n=1 Tax=Marinomonas posidonica (strain CECT 7376 / NCIMB 14433 / IVIA-Po-181) TaxID=491952 RepID=F6CWJ2_MARPP|nr:type II and III secretion system protein family protein [Marinomonas posidonica]AEF53247.1 type II and III secretion system protein [Marinomonas posidonica IVIA-Po-181]